MNSSSDMPRAGSGREAPSGRQFEITSNGHRATVAEVGGGLRGCRLAGEEVLDGYGPAERCTGARGLPLIPWPNRIQDGAYRFDGTSYQVPLTEPDAHNAIHGFLRWRNCRLDLDAARLLPAGEAATAGSACDFRAGRQIGGQDIDVTFTGLARDPDGRAWARLSAPGGRNVAQWADENYPFIEIYTATPSPRRTGAPAWGWSR